MLLCNFELDGHKFTCCDLNSSNQWRACLPQALTDGLPYLTPAQNPNRHSLSTRSEGEKDASRRLCFTLPTHRLRMDILEERIPPCTKMLQAVSSPATAILLITRSGLAAAAAAVHGTVLPQCAHQPLYDISMPDMRDGVWVGGVARHTLLHHIS